jgi:hypothetical protein
MTLHFGYGKMTGFAIGVDYAPEDKALKISFGKWFVYVEKWYTT